MKGKSYEKNNESTKRHRYFINGFLNDRIHSVCDDSTSFERRWMGRFRLFLMLFVFLVSAVILTIPSIVISIRKQFKLERLLSFFSGVMRIKKRSKI